MYIYIRCTYKIDLLALENMTSNISDWTTLDGGKAVEGPLFEMLKTLFSACIEKD
jgi:hypothetical protein